MARVGDNSHLGSSNWKRLRLIVLKRDEYTCQYCHDQANSVDHVIPRVKGGSDSLDNLVACCKPCNSAKGGRDVAPKPGGDFFGRGIYPPSLFPSISPLMSVTEPTNPFIIQNARI